MFFQDLDRFQHQTAVVNGGRRWTYLELAGAVSDVGHRLPTRRSLIVLRAANTLDTLVAYLACLQCGHAALLVDSQRQEESLSDLLERYDANAIVHEGQVHIRHDRPPVLSEDLALLLSTSGSTGSPKQVALSARNLDANARSICDYLPIQAADITITTLPFYYSYGLSVINTHLMRGACLILNEEPVISRGFWDRVKAEGVTSLAGVPFTYEMLLKLRLTTMDLPDLRYLTQAGGKLAQDHIQTLADWAISTNRQFFVMYGQTEATARMAFNGHPHSKPGSIGVAIPGGEFRLCRQDGSIISQSEEEGELSYRGPNVMLGYAESVKDLGSFSPEEWLPTGDLAFYDRDGDVYISGRIKRFIKPFGQRISLDDVERLLQEHGLLARATGTDRALQVAIVKDDTSATDEPTVWLSRTLALHPSAIQVRYVDALPVLGNGKPDYQTLRSLFDDL